MTPLVRALLSCGAALLVEWACILLTTRGSKAEAFWAFTFGVTAVAAIVLVFVLIWT